jgi:hypothetical protein
MVMEQQSAIVLGRWSNRKLQSQWLFSLVELDTKRWLSIVEDYRIWCDHYIGGIELTNTDEDEEDIYFHYESSDANVKAVANLGDNLLVVRIADEKVATLFKLTFV